MLAELRSVMGLQVDPDWVEIKRWSLARPRTMNADPFFFDGRIGMCGDGWGSVSRIETAWMSGDRLGRHIAASLNPTNSGLLTVATDTDN